MEIKMGEGIGKKRMERRVWKWDQSLAINCPNGVMKYYIMERDDSQLPQWRNYSGRKGYLPSSTTSNGWLVDTFIVSLNIQRGKS